MVRLYKRGFSFAGFQANQPRSPLPGQRLDIELDEITGTLGKFDEALAGVLPLPPDSLAANLTGSTAYARPVSIEAFKLVLGLDKLQPKLAFTPENAVNKGAAGGYAPLGSDSKVPAANLPPVDLSGLQPKLNFTPENVDNRGAANGYAPLGADKKVPLANLPDSGGGPITAAQITDASDSGRGVLKGTPAQGLAVLANPGLFGGVQGAIKAPNNPENQTGFKDQKGSSYEAFSVDVGGYGPSKFGEDYGQQFGLPQAVCGKMVVPADSTMYAHAIGLGGWIKNYSPDARTFAVGIYGEARAMAKGACSWALNTVSLDNGFETPLLYGYECDINVRNPNTTALGVDIVGGSIVKPSANSCALHIQCVGFGQGTAKIPWPTAIAIRAGSCDVAMRVEPRVETPNVGCAPIRLMAMDGNTNPYEAGRLLVVDGGNLVLASTSPAKVLSLQAMGLDGNLKNNITCYGANVGIGGAGLPAYTLDVTGEARITGSLLIGTNLQVNGVALVNNNLQVNGSSRLQAIGFNGNSPVGRQVVTGRLSDGSALASLLAALSTSYGLVDASQVTF